MSRPFIIRVRNTATGAFVPDVKLEVRTRLAARRYTGTLLERDDDGFLSGMLDGVFGLGAPTFVRVSAPGFADGPWETVPPRGAVSMDLELIPLSAAELIETAFSARVRIVTRAMGVDIDRDWRGITGRMSFDLVNGTMTLVELARVIIPVEIPILGSFDVGVDVTSTGPGTFDRNTGHGTLQLQAEADAGVATIGNSTVPMTLSTRTGFPDIGMTAFALSGKRMRMAGLGTGQGGPLNNTPVNFAATFSFDDVVPLG